MFIRLIILGKKSYVIERYVSNCFIFYWRYFLLFWKFYHSFFTYIIPFYRNDAEDIDHDRKAVEVVGRENGRQKYIGTTQIVERYV